MEETNTLKTSNLLLSKSALLKAMFTTHLNALRLTVFTMSLLSLLSFYDYYALGNHSIADEGAFIESITAFAFLFTAVTLLFQSFAKKHLERLNTLFFATTCFLFFIREVELESISAPYLVHFLSDGIGRAILFISAYLIIITFAVSRYQIFNIRAVRGYMKSPVTKLVLIACLGIAAGALLEELHLQLLEEISEMNASLLLLLAAVIHHKEVIYEG